MSWQVIAEIPDPVQGRKTLVTVSSEWYSMVWERMDWMKAQGWRILSAPERADWPTFPVDLGNAA